MSRKGPCVYVTQAGKKCESNGMKIWEDNFYCAKHYRTASAVKYPCEFEGCKVKNAKNIINDKRFCMKHYKRLEKHSKAADAMYCSADATTDNQSLELQEEIALPDDHRPDVQPSSTNEFVNRQKVEEIVNNEILNFSGLESDSDELYDMLVTPHKHDQANAEVPPAVGVPPNFNLKPFKAFGGTEFVMERVYDGLKTLEFFVSSSTKFNIKGWADTLRHMDTNGEILRAVLEKYKDVISFEETDPNIALAKVALLSLIMTYMNNLAFSKVNLDTPILDAPTVSSAVDQIPEHKPESVANNVDDQSQQEIFNDKKFRSENIGGVVTFFKQ